MKPRRILAGEAMPAWAAGYLTRYKVGQSTIHLTPAEPWATTLCGRNGMSLYALAWDGEWDWKLCSECAEAAQERAGAAIAPGGGKGGA